MNIEQLHDEWDKDCIVNDDHLDRESVKTPQLHAKYLRILISHKMKLAALEVEYKTLRQKKFRYFRGEMTKPELEDLQWNQWQGIKPLKNEMEEFLSGDNDLNKLEIKTNYIQNIVEFLESIMNQIKARDWQIRNSIEWKKFISGA